MFGGGRGEFFIMRFGEEGAKPHLSWSLLRRVFSYAPPYALGILALLLLILATTGIGLIAPLIFRELIDRAIPQGDGRRITLLAAALVAVPMASSVLGILERRVNAGIGSGVIYDLRVALYGHLQRMSLAFFTHTKTGELMSRLNNDVIGAQTAISNTIVDIVTNLVTVAATVLVMLAMEWRLTLLGLAILPVFSLLGRLLGKRLRLIAREMMERNARMNAIMNETLNISGLLLVKLFGRRKTEVERFGSQAASVRDISIRQAVAGGQLFMFMGMATAVTTGVVYLVGGHLAIAGVFTIGSIVAYSAYLTQLYGPLRALASAPVMFAQSMVSFERVFEVLDLPVEIGEKPGATSLERVRGEIEFDDVSFAYSERQTSYLSSVKRLGQSDEPVFSGALPGGATVRPKDARERRTWALDHLSFRIQPGMRAALVGPSGAGKTTVTYLIPRLYDPTGGRILLDGRDLRDLTLDTLSAHIGMVTQETYLFHDTLRTNLLYARPDASEGEIREACKAANIYDFINGLPDGYDTVVGERGYRLSGGEKQRVALARIILKDPRVLLLDEATSHLDSHSEALIQEAFARVMEGRTSLVIAHRLSTVRAADLILVMNHGRIEERGRHEELLRHGGLYSRLYKIQFSRRAQRVEA